MLKNIKLTSLFLLFLTTLNINAQKIKVKRGKILANKKPVAFVKKSGSSFNFSNLNQEKIEFSVKFNLLKITEDVSKKWLVVSIPDKNQTTEVEMEYLSFTMSNKKAISELFFKKYKIITDNGIDTNQLNDFFAIKRKSLTDQYNKLLKGEVAVKNEIANLDIKIDHSFNRIFEGNIPYASGSKANNSTVSEYPNMLGTYTTEKNSKYNGNIYTIYDLDKNKIATATPASFGKVTVATLNKKDSFVYTSKLGFSHNTAKYDNANFIKEIVGKLYTKGILLGHQLENQRKEIEIANQELRKKQFELDLKKYREDCKKSVNLYKVKGYIISSRLREQVDGKITILFEDVPVPNSIKEFVSKEIPKTIGRSFKFFKKRKTKVYSAKSNKIISFCVYDKNNKKRCFEGLSAKGLNMDNLSIDNSKFYERVPHKGLLEIYKFPTKDKYLVYFDKSYGSTKLTLKKLLVNTKKALVFNTVDKEKNIKNIKNYIGDKCYNEKINDLNYSDINDIKKFVELTPCVNK